MHIATVNNGALMAILGFGVHQLRPGETESADTTALAAGYRLIDTAAAYRNEAAMGAEVDYIDLYLIHQPFGDYCGQWRAMEKINEEGCARSIGVSNFPTDRLLNLAINNEIAPAVNQIEANPFISGATKACAHARVPRAPLRQPALMRKSA